MMILLMMSRATSMNDAGSKQNRWTSGILISNTMYSQTKTNYSNVQQATMKYNIELATCMMLEWPITALSPVVRLLQKPGG
jgi:hypothetical protein